MHHISNHNGCMRVPSSSAAAILGRQQQRMPKGVADSKQPHGADEAINAALLNLLLKADLSDMAGTIASCCKQTPLIVPPTCEPPHALQALDPVHHLTGAQPKLSGSLLYGHHLARLQYAQKQQAGSKSSIGTGVMP
jgi:hypothetical protein